MMPPTYRMIWTAKRNSACCIRKIPATENKVTISQMALCTGFRRVMTMMAELSPSADKAKNANSERASGFIFVSSMAQHSDRRRSRVRPEQVTHDRGHDHVGQAERD